MNGKRKPAHGGNHERAAGAETGKETISDEYFSTAATGSQAGKVLSLLLEGEENALSAAELTQLAGFKNERSLRQAVDRERENSVILASDRGYFRPQSGDKGLQEIRAFVRRMDSRMRSNRQTIRACKRALKAAEKAQLPGQGNFFDGGGGNG